MISLLLVTAQPEIAAQLETLCREEAFRLRSVSTLHAARDWLTLQPFQALIVDRAVDPLRAHDLVELAWKYSPMMSGLIISQEPSDETWIATLIGAKVFIGPHALDRLKTFLRALPRSTSLVPEKRHKLLFVEDLDAPREIVTSYIESLGFPDVDAVAKGTEALAKLIANPSDYFCVIADIRMPGMSGITLTEQIRNTPEIADIPVVMLTAEPTADHLVQAVRAGASGFLAKPPRKAALLKEIEKARRMITLRLSPRLCEPEDVSLLEQAIRRRMGNVS